MRAIAAILRASVEFGHAESAGWRCMGPDEDEFTLAAGALERVLDPPGAATSGLTAHLVGEFPPAVEYGLAALAGTTVTLRRHPAGPSGWTEAIASAAGETGGLRLVLGVDPGRATDPGGHAAVASAILVGEAPGIDLVLSSRASAGPATLPSSPGIGRPPTNQMAFLAHAQLGRAPQGAHPTLELPRRDGSVLLRAAHPIDWRGEWAGPARAGLAFDPGAWGTAVRTAIGSVSQGAYVPAARYRENLPSRWRFEGVRCGACGSANFPSSARCPACGATEGLLPARFPRDDLEVLATTVIARGAQPTEFDAQVDAIGPYGVVLVALAPGARVTLMVADAAPGAIRIGDRVATSLRRLYPMEGEWRYGRKAIALRPPG